MAARFDRIGPDHRRFIERQHVFFVASAAKDAKINLSPKGLDALRVLDETAVVYLDRTGSGNETAAHLKADGRLTFMFCAFEGPPLILRLYGRGCVLPRGGRDYAQLLDEQFGGQEPIGARQMVRLDVEMLQTSCGYGVPTYLYAGERPSLDNWAQAADRDLAAYRAEKNLVSLDGLPTGLVEAED
ncbi:pyridoxamine 5'-phosphate oxidase family protein [Phenylobacterium sp.]|uniref:pyridoxamine 5'-phosphate oxidase family protein n=1 Tax=Phenylobacterium sp. TaxID=1871053 RepID=UPI002DE85442|nr:pyridoxamine 5'-phosphate oxidase family protein [Phenylobacterium sp.]